MSGFETELPQKITKQAKTEDFLQKLTKETKVLVGDASG
jgi:hypothetical protein